MTLGSPDPASSSPPRGGSAEEFYEVSDLENCDLTSLNGKTVQSGAYAGDDEDAEDELEMVKQSRARGFLSYFMTGAGSTFLLLFFFSSIFGIVGGSGYAMGLTTPILYNLINAWHLAIIIAFVLGSLAVIRLTLNLMLRLVGLVAPWNWIHYAKELEPHVASITWLLGLLAACNYVDMVLYAPNRFVRPFLLKVILSSLILVLCLAIKSHYMRGLAMSFNYENYRDRIEMALRTDRIIQMLWKARHTYKFRKRVRRVDQRTPGTFWRQRSNEAPPSPHRQSLSVDHSKTISGLHSGPISGPSSGFAAPPSASPTSHSAQATPISHSVQQNVSNASSKTVTLTEAEKKENFVKFSKLAAKTMGMASSSSADFRLENSRESRKQASKLFKYMKPDDRAYLVPQDLRVYIEDEADFQFAIDLLKKNIKWQNCNPGTDDFIFGERALRKMIQYGLNELVMIVKSMQSIETALNKVDWIFSLVIVLIVGLVCSIMFGNAVQLLLAMATFLSGAAFIFSTTAKNAFESLVFLLLLHPFDVGDRVFINLNTFITPTASTIPSTMSGSEALDNLLVVEMHLLSTVFERWDGVKLYVPNYVLAMKPVFNIRRSGPLVELQRIQISFETPLTKINDLRDRLDKFVRSDRTDFTDLSRVNFDAIESCNKIHLNVIAQYTGNWQDIDKQLAFRSRFLMFIKQSLEELGIGYMPPVQRIAFVDRKGNALDGVPQAMLTP